MKDRFEKAKDVAQIIALVAVPIMVGFIGWQIQISVKEREISRDYVQLAVSVLSSKDAPKELRGWSAELVNNFAPVKLSDDALIGLISGDINLPESVDFSTRSQMISESVKRFSELMNQRNESNEGVK